MTATATAQQLLVNALIAKINDHAYNPPFTASSPSPGVLRLSCIAAIEYIRVGSFYFAAGAGSAVTIVNPGGDVRDLLIPHTIVPGDRLEVQFKSRVSNAFSVSATLNPTVEVLPGGYDHTTRASTVPQNAASDRRLVVMEAAAGHPSQGKLFAIPPGQATGIPMPTFRVLRRLPATGVTEGEAVYDSTTRTAYVWSGTRWMDVSPSPVTQFPNDTALKADTTLPAGAYAIASDTGNMYARGAVGWRRVGITQVARTADLPSDAAPGDQAIAVDVGVLYARLPGTPAGPGGAPPATPDYWVPTSLYAAPEATIRAATWPLNGQKALSDDTGRTFLFAGGQWIEEPIQHYDTEVHLLAATPPDGTLAWSDDTHIAFTRAAGAWHRLGDSVAVGPTAPTNKPNGALWLDTGKAKNQFLSVYDASSATAADHEWVKLEKARRHGQSSGQVYHITVEVSAVNWVELDYTMNVLTDTKPAVPSCSFEGWTNLRPPQAAWTSEAFTAGSYQVESAYTQWVLDHNIHGSQIEFGHSDGGTGWYVFGLADCNLKLKAFGTTQTAIQFNATWQRRGTSGYMGKTNFTALISKPLTSLTGLEFGAMGQAFNCAYNLSYG